MQKVRISLWELSCYNEEKKRRPKDIESLVINMKQERMYCCPVDAVLGVIGGKYKPIILYHLIDQTLRFSELRRYLPQATPKMLTQQLRELEADGIIHREIYPVVPPKTEYSLTEFGRTITPVLTAMCDWGKEYMSDKIQQDSV